MKRYIVVDDDSINNLICELTIKKFEPDAEIKLFTKPEEALEYICNEENSTSSILLLDINMPSMSGWDFLEIFSTLDGKIRINYSVFILSSSLEDPSDKFEIYSDLLGFYSKPLNKDYLKEINEVVTTCRRW